MKTLIKLSNLTLQYKKAKEPTLENINFEVNKAQMIAIVGPSGVGKSTLLKSLVKALKPQNGKVEIFNQNIYKTSKKEWNQIINKIGFLTQKPNLLSNDNVYNNVLRSINQYENSFFKLIGFVTKKQKQNIFKTLDELSIIDKAFYRISDLSGGQQQRVEIAKLLVKDVKLILADEPTSNLDNKTAKEVLEILKTLKNQKDITILVNIHDLSLIKKYFDRAIVIKNKTIVFDKKVKNFSQKELIKLINE